MVLSFQLPNAYSILGDIVFLFTTFFYKLLNSLQRQIRKQMTGKEFKRQAVIFNGKNMFIQFMIEVAMSY